MARQRAYLDHNATSPLHPVARTAMLAALDLAGNASSVHAEGRAARAVIETARAEVARFVGTASKNVVFTSGGTEALNLALSPDFIFDPAGRSCAVLLHGAGEHAAVIAGHRFAPEAAEQLPLTGDGHLDLAGLEAALLRHAGRTPMLALQAANNETGIIQPVAEAARLVHAAGGALVCDAVQAAGRITCDFKSLGADALILSGHKFGGPKGVGALCFATQSTYMRSGLVRGGGQERGSRAGTENVAAIAGMAAALGYAAAQQGIEAARLEALRDELERVLLRIAPNSLLFGRGVARLPNTSCFAIPGLEAQVLLMALDVEGVAVSSGSACSSGKLRRSHVLDAMGVAPGLAQGAVRVSFGWTSGAEEISSFGTALDKVLRTIKAKQVRSAA